MNQTPPAQIYEKSLEQVKVAVLDAFEREDVTILLFGSRVRGDAERCSEIVIGILPKNKYDRKKLILLKEKLEDINIPYKVDVVDISKVSQAFREKVMREGKIWKN